MRSIVRHTLISLTSPARSGAKRRTLGAICLALAACAPVAAGCHKPPPPQAAAGADAPPGQAWLTPEQVNEAHIIVTPLDEQNVVNTILSSGRVTFDDQRVAHVFSPVTGRVARIEANLGERLHKGQPLAVITSPDIGQASSDLGKADAISSRPSTTSNGRRTSSTRTLPRRRTTRRPRTTTAKRRPRRSARTRRHSCSAPGRWTRFPRGTRSPRQSTES